MKLDQLFAEFREAIKYPDDQREHLRTLGNISTTIAEDTWRFALVNRLERIAVAAERIAVALDQKTEEPCPSCGGLGRYYGSPCKACGGTGKI